MTPGVTSAPGCTAAGGRAAEAGAPRRPRSRRSPAPVGPSRRPFLPTFPTPPRGLPSLLLQAEPCGSPGVSGRGFGTEPGSARRGKPRPTAVSAQVRGAAPGKDVGGSRGGAVRRRGASCVTWCSPRVRGGAAPAHRASCPGRPRDGRVLSEEWGDAWRRGHSRRRPPRVCGAVPGGRG